MDWPTWLITLLDHMLSLSTPLIFAALGGICAERSGTVDIGLEGKMLGAAFAAAAAAAISGSAWVGLLAGMFASFLLAMLHGIATIIYRGDHGVTGLAINFLASGLTVVLGTAWFHMGGQTPSLSGDARFAPIDLPGVDWAVEHLSYVGLLYEKLISGQHVLVYLAFIAIFAVSWILSCTTFGLRLRAVGEEPNAVDTAGISVAKTRFYALAMTGVLCGLAGTTYSVALNTGFTREMTGGEGYIALAAVIFGKWRPASVTLACLLFGFLSAFAARIEGVDIPGIGVLPTQLFAALPYALTVVLLAGFIGRAVAPKALGLPYIKER